MKKLTLMTLAAMSLGLASCVKDVADYDPQTVKDGVTNAYNAAFVNTFGTPAPNQTWGFTSENSSMRSATSEWNGTHTKPHSWESGFNFASEDEVKNMVGVVNVKDHMTQYGYDGTKGSVYYIPSDFEGELNMNWLKCEKDESFTFYNFGTVTSFHSMNVDGVNTLYNAGKMVFKTNPAVKFTAVYNRASSETEKGILEIQDNDAYAKIDNLYNSANLILGAGKDWEGKTAQANVKVNGVIYSTGTGIVELPGGADWMAGCHIDGIVYTDAYLKIQNSTDKYMCGVVSRNEGDNIDIVDKAGGLTTSYIKTNRLSLNGASVYLLNNGYVNANQIHAEGSSNSQLGSEYEAIVVEPVTGAKAFVETTSFDLPNVKIFGNHLGAGVYTKFETIRYYDENYEKTVVTKTAGEYFERYPNEAGKLAPETLGGVSECGGPWGKTTTTPTPDWTFLCRVFAEDLSATDATDFDFNDVVFDVYYDKNGTTNAAQIHLQAAGGTLPLYVGGIEVHGQFGEGYGSGIMINTGDKANVNNETAEPYLIQNVFTGNDKLDDVNTNINVVVTKFGEDVPLTAYEGKPAAKFAVTEKIVWPNERQAIEEKYPNFKSWVGDANVKWY